MIYSSSRSDGSTHFNGVTSLSFSPSLLSTLSAPFSGQEYSRAPRVRHPAATAIVGGRGSEYYSDDLHTSSRASTNGAHRATSPATSTYYKVCRLSQILLSVPHHNIETTSTSNAESRATLVMHKQRNICSRPTHLSLPFAPWEYGAQMRHSRIR
jgi:hypothetical protein